MAINYLISVPGSERKIISRKSAGIDLSMIALELDSRIEVEVLRKTDCREYDIGIEIKGLGSGKYCDGIIFFTKREAVEEQKRILAELKKRKKGKFQAVYRRDGRLDFYLR